MLSWMSYVVGKRKQQTGHDHPLLLLANPFLLIHCLRLSLVPPLHLPGYYSHCGLGRVRERQRHWRGGVPSCSDLILVLFFQPPLSLLCSFHLPPSSNSSYFPPPILAPASPLMHFILILLISLLSAPSSPPLPSLLLATLSARASYFYLLLGRQ